MLKPIFLLYLLLLSSCQSVFFYPSKTLVQTPTDLGLKYKDHFLEVAPNTKINMWELLPVGDEKGIILLLHGNAENISTHIMSVAWLANFGYRIYAFDYEGFGISEGSESVENSVRDAKVVFNFIKNQNKDLPLIVFGQSIGGAIGLYAFNQPEYRDKIDLFVVDSAFTSYRSIAEERLNMVGLMKPFSNLISLCATTCCDPIDVISEYRSVNMLFVHDELDPIVSKTNTDVLFSALPEGKKELWTQRDGKHTAFFSRLDNRDRFLETLKLVTKIN